MRGVAIIVLNKKHIKYINHYTFISYLDPLLGSPPASDFFLMVLHAFRVILQSKRALSIFSTGKDGLLNLGSGCKILTSGKTTF